jgi:hypothetical protein
MLLLLALTATVAVVINFVIWHEGGPVGRQVTDSALVATLVALAAMICAMPD